MSLQKIRPTVVRTQYVAKELLRIAKANGVKSETLDFNLLDIKTYTRVKDPMNDGDWEEIDPHEIEDLDVKTAMLHPSFEIKQIYEIEVFTKDPHLDNFSNFKVAVGANKTKCKIYLTILVGSEISYSPRLEKELRIFINKRKIRSGILVNIFDKPLDKTLSKITAFIRVAEYAKYKKKEIHLIAQCFEPVLTIDDALILHYEHKAKEELDEQTRVNYAERGFLKKVKKDELLIEYIKPKIGKPGRDCRGIYLAPKEPTVKHEPTFEVDESIKIVDTKDSIQYIAYANGYITFENNVYQIRTDVSIDEISFKKTGSISVGLDSDISINVQESNAIKDAIGEGMEVEVSEIDIDGNVGSNAKVIALKANIGGQTHKNAVIRADKLTINVHKGEAYGKNIHITRLEHGIVDGHTVEVAQAAGGNIRAKEITIDVCGSHVTATASKIIDIKKMQGDENTFIIDPLLKKSTKKSLEHNKEQIKHLEEDFKVLRKEIEKYTTFLQEGQAAFNDIKKRLVRYKKNGIKMPESFVKKYKEFQELQSKLKSLKEELAMKEDQYNLLTANTASFQENIFNARIVNHDRWIGYNEIIFKLVDPPIELVYKPKEGCPDKIFGLVQVDEEEYEIRALAE